MKKILLLSLVVLLCGFKVANFIIISGVKVPFEKICGNGQYECRATGIAQSNLPSYRIYLKERPSGAGKTLNSNYFNLGRKSDPKAFHYHLPCISLNRDDIEIDTTVVDYDMKKDNISALVADLKASLKKAKIDTNLSVKILNEYKKTLNNEIEIKANIITYTVKNEVIDSIRSAKDGELHQNRFVSAATSLRENNYPFIRQVIVIEEICIFKESKNITNLLKPLLTAELGSDNNQVEAVISLNKSNKKTSNFKSSYRNSSIYSYGYWSETWMFKK